MKSYGFRKAPRSGLFLARRNSVIDAAGFGGTFGMTCHDPDGNLKWESPAKNIVTNLALDDINNVYLRNGSPKANWYAGLIDQVSYTQLLNADTMSSHSGWVELTSYTETVRQTWTPGASASQTVVNGTVMTYTSSAACNIKGAFIASDSSKGGTTGLLFCTALLTNGTQPASIGDTLRLTYQFSGVTQ
jgi:hypothetical protein